MVPLSISPQTLLPAFCTPSPMHPLPNISITAPCCKADWKAARTPWSTTPWRVSSTRVNTTFLASVLCQGVKGKKTVSLLPNWDTPWEVSLCLQGSPARLSHATPHPCGVFLKVSPLLAFLLSHDYFPTLQLVLQKHVLIHHFHVKSISGTVYGDRQLLRRLFLLLLKVPENDTDKWDHLPES